MDVLNVNQVFRIANKIGKAAINIIKTAIKTKESQLKFKSNHTS